MDIIDETVFSQPGAARNHVWLNPSGSQGHDYPAANSIMPINLGMYSKPETSNTPVGPVPANSTRQITRPDGAAVWDQHQETIIDLYWNKEKTLLEVSQEMKSKYGFVAT